VEYNQYNVQKLLEQPALTEEERRWLLNFLKETNSEEVKSIAEEIFYKEANKKLAVSPDDSTRLLNTLHQRLDLPQPATKYRYLNKRWGWMAAASVLAVLLLGAFWRKEQNNDIAHLKLATGGKNKELPVGTPGRDGAFLTLSDGTTILLDSAHNGILNANGAENLVKRGGQLVCKGGKGSAASFHTMTTPKGRQFQIVLADGSQVWLNAASSIRFPTAFTGGERVVEVTGEVYFEIAKNPSMPFRVKAGDTDVEVLGTHFNVNSYGNNTKTTLLEGSVKIKTGSHTGILKPGQQAKTFENNGLHVTGNIDMEGVMAWKNGRFVFEGADLKTIMEQISRWYDVDVVYEDGVPQRTFSADISRSTPLDHFLKVLEVSGVRFSLEGQRLTVKK
jgi:transmembrane sensor